MFSLLILIIVSLCPLGNKFPEERGFCFCLLFNICPLESKLVSTREQVYNKYLSNN